MQDYDASEPLAAARGSLGPPGLRAGGVRYVAARLIAAALFVAILLLAANRLDWGRAWILLAITVAGEAISAFVLARLNPAMLNQRGTLMRAGTKRFEKVVLPCWFVVSYVVAVVAGVDAGRVGAPSPSAVALAAGIALMAAGYALGTWAMAVNPYFEPTVRIQTERGHRVVSNGPYRHLRHPGYAGALLGAVATPLILGSDLAFLPVIASMLLLALRAALEDRTLQRELPGYAEYAQRTRHRLLPGVW